MRSAPRTCSTGPRSDVSSIFSSSTDESPIGFGLNGERVAKTPMRTFPPRRGGRTMGCHSPSRRTHRRRPFIRHGFGKAPYQPYVRKSLEPAHGLRLTVFRLKHYLALYVGRNSALTRYSEFCVKGRVYSCYYFHFRHMFHLHLLIFSVCYYII